MSLMNFTSTGNTIQPTADQNFWSAIFLPSVLPYVLKSVLLFLIIFEANAQAVYEPAAANGEKVIPAIRADQSVLLDVVAINTDAGERLIAVGERGHILISDDSGQSWQQSVEVPTRTLLTSITAHSGHLWAAGHQSTILISDDNGNSWRLQYSDLNADPILDIHFDDAQNGYAVGAYGLFMRTENGGVDWDIYLMNELVVNEPEAELITEGAEVVDHLEADEAHGFIDQSALDDYEDDDVDYHLNNLIRVNADTLLVAAESGRGYYSNNSGETWQPFRLPYDGSMFGGFAIQNGRCVLVFGLRGNVFRSCDGYKNWIPIDTGVVASLFGASRDSDGRLWLAGANGTLLRVSADAITVEQIALDDGDDLTSLHLTAEHIILLGESGLQRIALNSLQNID